MEYEVYRPGHHPIWEIYRDETLATQGKVRTRPAAVGPWADDLKTAQREADDAGAFDPTNEADGRKRVMRTIVSRLGQQRFRDALLEAYDGTCAMTGSTAVDVLEAAHIVPYKGDHTNATQNGLLLRADVHRFSILGISGLKQARSASRHICPEPNIRASLASRCASRRIPGLRRRSPPSSSTRSSQRENARTDRQTSRLRTDTALCNTLTTRTYE